ncbi:MAG: AEC family transporter [Acholeplasmatales bacterium]|nr:AEC family transporter [Acholeplasmatales bacterium]
MNFTTTLFNVLIVLLFAFPAFILAKLKRVDAAHSKSIATILLYMLSPCMIINAFQGVERSKEMVKNMLIFTLITLGLQLIMIGTAFLVAYILDRKRPEENHLKKVGLAGTALGNVGFFGLPIVTALLPDYPEAAVYSSLFVLSMNLIIFTVGAYAVTGKKEYMSIKGIILNPTTISVIVALILYGFDVHFEDTMGDFGPIFDNAIELLAKMTTPVSMIVLGIRLGTTSLKKVFTNYHAYIVSAVKLVVFPLMCYVIVYFTPLPYSMRASIVILACAPCASVLLNLAEMLGSEQEYAANVVLISTLLSVITVPLVLLIL